MAKAFAIETICIYCNKPFLKRDKGGRGQIPQSIRPANVLTCSHECSMKYSIKKRNETRRRISLPQIAN